MRHAAREVHANEPLHRPWLMAVLVLGLATVSSWASSGCPREGAPLPDIARYALDIALPQWKTTEPVNEIVYSTRGFDTFGETFLLLAAVVSVMTLARPREPRCEYVGEATAGSEQRRIDPHKGRATSGETAAQRAEQAEESEAARVVDPDVTPSAHQARSNRPR